MAKISKFQRAQPKEAAFIQQVGAKETRKLQAHRTRIIWSGLGLFGLVGWSIVVPTLLGTMLGIWLDKHHPAHHSWTLSLLIIGLCAGCWNAWHWIDKENQKIRRKDKS